MEVKPRRVGGATYQVPMEVPQARRTTLAIRWVLDSARARSGKSFAEKLADELMDAYKNEGASIRNAKKPIKWPRPIEPSLTTACNWRSLNLSRQVFFYDTCVPARAVSNIGIIAHMMPVRRLPRSESCSIQG